MTRFIKSSVAVTILLGMLGLALLCPVTARASEAGRRNTTLGLGAATAYFLVNKQWVPAAIAGVGTGIALHNWQAQINHRHRVAYFSRNTRSYHGYTVVHTYSSHYYVRHHHRYHHWRHHHYYHH